MTDRDPEIRPIPSTEIITEGLTGFDVAPAAPVAVQIPTVPTIPIQPADSGQDGD